MRILLLIVAMVACSRAGTPPAPQESGGEPVAPAHAGDRHDVDGPAPSSPTGDPPAAAPAGAAADEPEKPSVDDVLADALARSAERNARHATLAVEVPAPTGAHRATLVVRVRAVSDLPAPQVRVTVGTTQHEVAPGTEARFPIAADPRRLQRWTIAGEPVLVHVPPGAIHTLVDSACAGWDLRGARLDAHRLDHHLAYCKRPEEPCRPGYLPISPVTTGGDDLCRGVVGPEQRGQRCALAPTVRLRGPSPAAVALTPAPAGSTNDFVELSTGALAAGETTPAQPVQTAQCDHARAQVDGQVTVLVPAFGARWTLTVDDSGALTGVVEP